MPVHRGRANSREVDMRLRRMAIGLVPLAAVAGSCREPNGCRDTRVVLVDGGGNIVWQYGQPGIAGSGADQLNTPVQATALPYGDILITDQANERIIEVAPDHRVVWQYGQ